MSEITPSQTIGPYFAIGLAPKGINWIASIGNNLVTADAIGERIRIEGRVLDADGSRVNDAMLEIWQADAAGRYAHPADHRAPPNARFKGFGRTATDGHGAYGFETIKPGAVPGPDGRLQAPHIVMAVFARGMLRHQHTRIYFSDEAANAIDPVLELVPQARRATLLALRRPGDEAVYGFDVRLQGDGETVFFSV
jgi:protocatechuate 3,4-dioxygenase, alpha subunit